MNKLDIVGIGTWSPFFGNWDEFRHGVETGKWQFDIELQPDLIPSRELRRAPQLVKMAVEVMSQACDMASATPDDVAAVFSSAMGDMQITDYMCRALAETPKLISPTKFHNSVHNAAPGYWSITTGAFSAGNAVSAFGYTSTMALLEASIQASEENLPVLVVTQEIAATRTLKDICPSEQPFAAGLLLAPPGSSTNAMFSMEFTVEDEPCQWPATSEELHQRLGSNTGAKLLPLLSNLALLNRNDAAVAMRFPVSEITSLNLSFTIASKNG
jgi:Beta-ketoacyl synthase, N-terminal domain